MEFIADIVRLSVGMTIGWYMLICLNKTDDADSHTAVIRCSVVTAVIILDIILAKMIMQWL